MRSKEKIILKFEQSRIRYETKTNEINKLVQDYGLSNFMQHFSRQPYKKDDILLFQHSICCAIVSQKRFEEKDFISDKREILSLANE